MQYIDNYNHNLLYSSFSNQNNIIENSKIDEVGNDLKKKSVGFWKCVGQRIDDLSGGKFFDFEFSDQYLKSIMSDNKNFAIEMRGLLFPAVQDRPRNSLFHLKKDPSIGAANFGEIISPTLKFLGYDYRVEENCIKIQKEIRGEIYSTNKNVKKYFMTLPDAKALSYWWEELRKKYPTLPQLTIVSAEGIANDRMFIEIYLEGKLILSSDEEFIHDHTIHILATIFRIFDASNTINYEIEFTKEFEESNEDLKNKIKEISFLIETLGSKLIEEKRAQIVDGLFALMGSFVDVITSKHSIEDFKSLARDLDQAGDFIRSEYGWTTYMGKRFDKIWYETNILQDFWRNLVERVVTNRYKKYKDENFKILSGTQKYFDLFIDPGISDRSRQMFIRERERFARIMKRDS